MKTRLLLLVATMCLLEVNCQNIIPRKILFGHPDHSNVQISDDGQWLTYAAAYKGVLNIYAKRLPNGVEYALTRIKQRGIYSYWWLHDNRTILYIQDKDGDENWMITTVDLNTGLKRHLTDFSHGKAFLLASSPLVPYIIIIGINRRDNRYFDAYKVDIRTGRTALVFKNDLYVDMSFDKQLRLRMACNETDEGSLQYFMLEPENNVYNAKLHKVFNVEDALTSQFVGFHMDGKTLYWQSNERKDLAALIAEDLETGQSELLYEPAKGDTGYVISQPLTGEPAIVYNQYNVPEGHALLPEVETSYVRMKRSLPEHSVITVTSTTLDFKTWIVEVSSDTRPITYFICDFKEEMEPCKLLFHKFDGLVKYQMSPVNVAEVKTRDNLTQVCFLTLPYDSFNASGIPSNPMPTVVMVHGGPWAQDVYGFDKESQLLASRGYVVISCNFRGSTGYGKKFLSAGNGEWGRKMQYDLLDAIDWAVERNYTAREKVAIYGGSYGGYAALAGLAFTPNVFACGVDICGPSNLITMLDSIPPYWKPLYNNLVYRLGASTETEEEREYLRQRSPLFYADRIRKPLLIAQGANDPRVKQNESEQMIEALQFHNISATYLLYPNEGHGFQIPENRLSVWTFMEEFLQQCLGGVAEPPGSDLRDSNFILRVVKGSSFQTIGSSSP